MADIYFGKRAKPGVSPLTSIYWMRDHTLFHLFAGDWWPVFSDAALNGGGTVPSIGDVTAALATGSHSSLSGEVWNKTHDFSSAVKAVTTPMALVKPDSLRSIRTPTTDTRWRVAHMTSFRMGSLEWVQAEVATVVHGHTVFTTPGSLSDAASMAFAGPTAEAAAKKWIATSLSSGRNGWWFYEGQSIPMFGSFHERHRFAWVDDLYVKALAEAESLDADAKRIAEERERARIAAEEKAAAERKRLLEGATTDLSREDFAKVVQARIRARKGSTL
jgi:hypothetical protein